MIGYTNTALPVRGTGASSIRLLAGDYIDIRPSTSVTVSGGALSAADTAQIVITKVGNY